MTIYVYMRIRVSVYVCVDLFARVNVSNEWTSPSA